MTTRKKDSGKILTGKILARKILLRAPNWIGDAVMCLPALSALKTLYPGSDIAVLANSLALPVFENHPAVSDLIEYDSKGRHRGAFGKLRLAREIKQRKFDAAVLFQNAFEAALITFLARIPVRVGYARDFRTRLLTNPVPCTPLIMNVHQVVYYLNLVRELGADVQVDAVPSIHITPEEVQRAGVILSDGGLSEADVLIGSAPGASYGPAKRWPPERFAEALERLSVEYSAVPVIFGGGEDTEAASKVSEGLRRSGVRHLDLAGRTGLREFMALTSLMKLFITNDSGPMHVSAALGVPTIAVFGSTDPDLTGPYGRRATAVTRVIACSPCFKRVCDSTGGALYECLTEVKTEEVCKAARELIGHGEVA